MNHPFSPETQAIAAAIPHVDRSTAKCWIVVTQVKSNRVVYFTDDADYQPAMDGDWYFVSQYLGELPAAMTLRNCWGWRFNGGVFKDVRDPEPKPQLEQLLESNRRALLALLRDKISQARNRYSPTCAMGADVRHLKRLEAQRYLAGTASADQHKETDSYPMLSALATARGISLREAAVLVEGRQEDTLHMLALTEQVREHYVQAIHRTQSQDDMIRLRRELLDTVLPDLSSRFPFPASAFVPEDWDRPLSEIHKVHETARLRAQLREIVNAKRSAFHEGYLGNDHIARKRLVQARALLDGSTTESAQDLALLESYANRHQLVLQEAALQLVQAAENADEALVSTELMKDAMQARIDAVANLRDIRAIGRDLLALASGADFAKS